MCRDTRAFDSAREAATETGDFSNVHNFVKKFVWDPIQSTYCTNRAARHLRLKTLLKSKNKIKVVQSMLTSTVFVAVKSV